MKKLFLFSLLLSLYSCIAPAQSIRVCQLPATSVGTTNDWLMKEDSTCSALKKIKVSDFLSHYSIGSGGNPSGLNKLQYDSAGHFGGAKIGYVEISSQPFFFYDSTQTFTISQNNAKTLIRLDSNLLLLKSAGFTDTIPHASGTIALTSQLPSLTRSRVAFGSSSNTITSDANFIYADTTGSGPTLATTFSLSLPGAAVVFLKDRKNLTTHSMQVCDGVFSSTISNTGVFVDANIKGVNSNIEFDDNSMHDAITVITDTFSLGSVNGSQAGITVYSDGSGSGQGAINITTDSLKISSVNGVSSPGNVLMDLNGVSVFTEQQVSSSQLNNDVPFATDFDSDVDTCLAIGSATSLTNNTVKNIITVTLAKGTWDVSVNINFKETTSTVTARSGGINKSIAATIPIDGHEVNNGVQSVVTSELNSISTRDLLTLTVPTAVSMTCVASFSAGTCAAYGCFVATRIR